MRTLFGSIGVEIFLLPREGVVEVRSAHAVFPCQQIMRAFGSDHRQQYFHFRPMFTPVSARRSGMNSSLPLRPVLVFTASVHFAHVP